MIRKLGIEVQQFGINGIYRLIEPRDIIGADGIITIGKTAQYALCGGRPVYCYDHFGGPGWLSESNFKAAEFFNFSGRCGGRVITPRQIVDELTGGFGEAEQFARENWKVNSDNYNLENFLDKVLCESDITQLSDDKCLEEIDAMRGPLMHVEWIWQDVYSKDRVEAIKIKFDKMIVEKEVFYNSIIREKVDTIIEKEQAAVKLNILIEALRNKQRELRKALSLTLIVSVLFVIFIILQR